MLPNDSAKEDSGPGLTPWEVVAVRPLQGFRLWVTFADKTEGEVDLTSFLFQERPGVFEHLRDPARFAEVYVEDGAVTWPGELDLAPDAMYDDIRRASEQR